MVKGCPPGQDHAGNGCLTDSHNETGQLPGCRAPNERPGDCHRRVRLPRLLNLLEQPGCCRDREKVSFDQRALERGSRTRRQDPSLSPAEPTRINATAVPPLGLSRENVISGVGLPDPGQLPETSEDLEARGFVIVAMVLVHEIRPSKKVCLSLLRG